MRFGKTRRESKQKSILSQRFRNFLRKSIFEHLEDRRLLASIAWDGGGDGMHWHDPANWEGDTLPGPSDDVTIEVADQLAVIQIDFGQPTVVRSLDVDEAILVKTPLEFTDASRVRALEVQGSDPTMLRGNGDLIVDELASFRGGSVPGTGSLTIGAGANLEILSPTTIEKAIHLLGTAEIRRGLSGSAEFSIHAGATVNLFAPAPNSSSGFSGSQLISNQGTIVQLGGDTELAEFGTNTNFVNTGQLLLQGNGLELRGAGSTTTDIEVAAGSELHFFSTFAFAAGTKLFGAGNVELSGVSAVYDFSDSQFLVTGSASFGGIVTIANTLPPELYVKRIRSGDFTFNADQTFATEEIALGPIGGTGALTLTGNSLIQATSFNNTGGLRIAEGARVSIGAIGSLTFETEVENSGVINVNRNSLTVNGVLNNRARGSILVSPSSSFSFQSIGGSGQIINEGRLQKSGDGLSRILPNISQTTDSQFLIDGDLELAGTLTTASSVDIPAGAHLEADGGIVLQSGARLTGTGSIETRGSSDFTAGEFLLGGIARFAGQTKIANSFNPNLQVLSIAGDFESFSDQILTGTNLNANISGDAQFTFHGSGFWNRTTLDVDGIHLETDSKIRADGFISALGPATIAGELDLANAQLRIGASLEVTETGSILVAGGRFSSATGEVAELENAGTIRRSSGSNLTTLDVRIRNTGTLVNESREWTLNIHPDHVAQENGETILTGGTWIAGEDSQPPTSSNPTARPALLKFHDVPQIDRLAASVGLFRNNSGIVVGGSDRLLANLEQIDETGSLTLGHRILRGIHSESFVNRGTLRLEENSQLSLLHGDFAQSVEGKLEIEIGGLESESLFGAIDIQDGQATLAGHFEVELVNSFGPPVAESYEVISHNNLAGQFDQVSGLQLNRVPLFELASTSTSTRLVALVNTTDLSADSIVVPSDSQAGSLATVEYTVNNIGDIAAEGTWFDSLYLSLDNVLDTNDVLFARVEQNRTVADSYTQSVTAPLPAVPDDTYRFIMVTDSRGEVPDRSRRNNQTASLATVAIAAESLQFGVQKNASLNDRATLVYRLDVPPGVDVELEVSADAPSQINFMADTGNSGQLRDVQIDFDGSSQPAKKVLIAAPGIWYLGVRGRPENSGQTTNFSITARQAVFGFDSVSPAAGSNLGRVTSVVQGSGFSPQTSVTLVDPNENERGGSVTFVDTNTLFVTFDLRGLGTGNYTVRVADGELLKSADAAFSVNDSEAGRLEIEVVTEEFIRARAGGAPSLPRTHDIKIVYRNAGNTDIPAPLLELITESSVAGATAFRSVGSGRGGGGTAAIIPNPRPQNLENRVPREIALGISSRGPAGILAPGESGSVTFPKTIPSETVTHTHRVLTVNGSEENHDWLGSKEDLRPDAIQPDAWDIIFDEFIRRFASSYAAYERSLAEAATYLSSIGRPTSSVSELIGFLFAQVNNEHPGGVLAAAIDASTTTPGLPLSFGRVYSQAIASRLRVGAFGYGWSHPFELSLRTETLASNRVNVVVSSPLGDRLFRKNFHYDPFDITSGPEFFAADGDGGSLRGDPGLGSMRIVEPDGTTLEFNEDGRLVTVRDLVSRIELSYEGDQLIGLTHVDSAFAAGTETSITMQYNGQGRIQNLIDDIGRVTSYEYDTSGEHLVRVTNHVSEVTYAYQEDSNPLVNHALTSVLTETGNGVDYSYDDLGRLEQMLVRNSTIEVNVEYGVGGEVALVNSNGDRETLSFNEFGGIARHFDPLGNVHQRYFDANNNPDFDLLPGNIIVDYSIQNDGFLTSRTNAIGESLRFDPVLVQSGIRNIPGRGQRLRQVLDENDNPTRFTYNRFGRLTVQDYADGTENQLSYDTTNDLVQSTNRLGQSFTYVRDSQGRVTERTHPDGSRDELTYDAAGNLTQIVDSRGTTLLAYNAADQLTDIEYPSGRAIRYEYDQFERLTRLSDHAGFEENFLYDELGRLQEIRDAAGQQILKLSFDSLGRIVREDRGNGTFTTYTLDAAGQLAELTNHAPDGSVNSRFAYVLDELGRRTQMQSLDGEWMYKYDAIGQLVRAEFTSLNPDIPNELLEYRYDKAGNRLSARRNGIETLYIQNNLNQYIRVGDRDYQYDAAGNLTQITEDGETIAEYEYDALERLIGVRREGNHFQYEYDFFGNRIASIVNGKRTDYLVNPMGLGDVVAEYDDQGSLIANYSQGLGLTSRFDASGNAAYYDFDGVGSTVGISANSGNYLNQYGYLPFGESQFKSEALVGNPFQFVGQFGVTRDDSGLDFMRARFYTPEDGRFISDDPIGIEGGVNLYRYSENSPTNLIDPTGLFVAAAGHSLLRFGATWVLPRLRNAAIQNLDRIPTYAASKIGGEGLLENAVSDALANGGRELDRNLRGLDPVGQVLAGFTDTYEIWRDALDLPTLGELFRLGLDYGKDYALTNSERLEHWFLDCVQFGCDLSDEGAISFTTYVISRDPNDIVGPRGVGPLGHIQPTSLPLDYKIRFENLASAGANAAEVRILQTLDSDLDFSTFQFTGFGFDDQSFTVLQGDRVEIRLDLVEQYQVYLDVIGEFNQQTGELTWVFRSVDPVTFDFPLNPFAGFLPPNKQSPQGEGFIAYQIHHKRDLLTGTAIDAEARIFFDFNEPIDTPPIVNTIDRGAPESSVVEMPRETSETTFVVAWSGEDDAGGSGIATYDIFVSTDDGPFELFLANTVSSSVEFSGEYGSTYSFYSVATDAVGYTEAIPLSADTMTQIVSPTPWQNTTNPFDTNVDTFVSPLDALLIIQDLNENGGRALPPPASGMGTPPFVDVNGDNFASPIDALMVINDLNSRVGGEGEISPSLGISALSDWYFADLGWLDERRKAASIWE